MYEQLIEQSPNTTQAPINLSPLGSNKAMTEQPERPKQVCVANSTASSFCEARRAPGPPKYRSKYLHPACTQSITWRSALRPGVYDRGCTSPAMSESVLLVTHSVLSPDFGRRADRGTARAELHIPLACFLIRITTQEITRSGCLSSKGISSARRRPEAVKTVSLTIPGMRASLTRGKEYTYAARRAPREN